MPKPARLSCPDCDCAAVHQNGLRICPECKAELIINAETFEDADGETGRGRRGWAYRQGRGQDRGAIRW